VLGDIAGRNGLEHAQYRRRVRRGVPNVRPADRETVHGRVIERWNMARGADIFIEDPLVTLKKSYFFRRQRPNLLENELNGFSDSNHRVIITRSVATINNCCACCAH
jgi:hypothetical protein